MLTREIPRESWTSFLDSYSRQHESWRVSLEIVDPEIEAHARIQEVPLIRIGTSDDGILIVLRDSDGRMIRREIQSVDRLWSEETEEGAHKSLQIESSEGIQAIVSFRSAVLPEAMDGIVDKLPDRDSENGGGNGSKV